MKRGFTIIICIFISSILCSCSYKDLDDALQNRVKPGTSAAVADTSSYFEMEDTSSTLQDKSQPKQKTPKKLSSEILYDGFNEDNIVNMKIGESIIFPAESIFKGDIEFTLLKNQAFESVEASGIDIKECLPISNEVMSAPEEFLYLLLDIRIRNIDAIQTDGFNEDLPFLISDFFPVIETSENNPEMGVKDIETIYFSGHPPQTKNSTNYYHYNILPGEEKDYQLLIVVSIVDYDNNNIWLHTAKAGHRILYPLYD